MSRGLGARPAPARRPGLCPAWASVLLGPGFSAGLGPFVQEALDEGGGARGQAAADHDGDHNLDQLVGRGPGQSDGSTGLADVVVHEGLQEEEDARHGEHDRLVRHPCTPA
eukprot:CAMPEP_0206017242 /NCGR_PEP_ID=MMETSP1464-20131121/24607_1 /ASSEMBLY_ACC=CAM_ASM_001124 /TAXON_ID=119497 /ORGANISM="Exanthemachrysis gayraliae, Strain RCC1523" /LENGTH=110 /DNA_ID=CAMNT_0053391081 /DNA_START=106 /DNA_END=434 /DNA_ORIENTATION=+